MYYPSLIMSYHMLPAMDFLRLASKIVGKVKKLTIDTRIYKHAIFYNPSNYEDSSLNVAKDILIVEPKQSTYIKLEDLQCIIEHMDKQFKKIDRVASERSYFYEGLHIDYEQLHFGPNKGKYYYVIHWGS